MLRPVTPRQLKILFVEAAIETLKTRRTPGIDNLTSELFKDRGEDLRSKLIKLIQKIRSKENRGVEHLPNISYPKKRLHV